MTNKLSELLDKMPTKARDNVRSRTHSMAAELILVELRKAFDVLQEEFAGALSVDEAKLCEIEHRQDMLLSTLAAYVQAVGGDLEIIVHFPAHAELKKGVGGSVLCYVAAPDGVSIELMQC